MLLASPVGQPSRIKTFITKAIVWGGHTLHMRGWEFVTQQLPDVGRPSTAVCLCALSWVTDVGQRGFPGFTSTGFINDVARRFVHADFLCGSKIPSMSRLAWRVLGRVPFLSYQSNNIRCERRWSRILCWASFETHQLVWLLCLQHNVGIPFYSTGESCWSSRKWGEYPDKYKKELKSVQT